MNYEQILREMQRQQEETARRRAFNLPEDYLRQVLQSRNLIPTDREYKFAGVERIPGTSGLIQQR